VQHAVRHELADAERGRLCDVRVEAGDVIGEERACLARGHRGRLEVEMHRRVIGGNSADAGAREDGLAAHCRATPP
jgi:hypothetical protein